MSINQAWLTQALNKVNLDPGLFNIRCREASSEAFSQGFVKVELGATASWVAGYYLKIAVWSKSELIAVAMTSVDKEHIQDDIITLRMEIAFKKPPRSVGDPFYTECLSKLSLVYEYYVKNLRVNGILLVLSVPYTGGVLRTL